MELFLDIGSFAIKVLIISVAIAIVAIVFISILRRSRSHHLGRIVITNLNAHYRDLSYLLRQAVLDKKELKEEAKKEKEKKAERVFVVEFHGDIAATAVADLREQITAILAVARPTDEVVLLLESSGGIIQNYGLAASQLARFRDRDIPLTVCVDKIAASGGYLMACLGHKILAAPFATLGAIGIVVFFPNFHRLLKKFNIDYMELTAGEFKRTLSHLGAVTDKGKKKFQEEIDTAHRLLKDFVVRHRPGLDMEKIATGEHWHGTEAMELQLVDQLQTSDDYLVHRSAVADLYRVDYEAPKTVKEKFAGILSESVDRVLLRWWNRMERGTRFHL